MAATTLCYFSFWFYKFRCWCIILPSDVWVHLFILIYRCDIFITYLAHLTDGKIQTLDNYSVSKLWISHTSQNSPSTLKWFTCKLLDDRTNQFVLSLIVGLPRLLRKEKFFCMKLEEILVSTFCFSLCYICWFDIANGYYLYLWREKKIRS